MSTSEVVKKTTEVLKPIAKEAATAVGEFAKETGREAAAAVSAEIVRGTTNLVKIGFDATGRLVLKIYDKAAQKFVDAPPGSISDDTAKLLIQETVSGSGQVYAETVATCPACTSGGCDDCGGSSCKIGADHHNGGPRDGGPRDIGPRDGGCDDCGGKVAPHRGGNDTLQKMFSIDIAMMVLVVIFMAGVAGLIFGYRVETSRHAVYVSGLIIIGIAACRLWCK